MRVVPASLLLLALLAAPAPAADEIPWHRKLADAYAAAKEANLPILIAINSERVDGGRLEPAAKELREVTYKDARVVAAAKGFVCAYLTNEGSSDDFGELRLRYRVEGAIVSPQHIFAYADGSLITRHEYWPHGYGEKAVVALLDLMAKAKAKFDQRAGLPPGAPVPESPAEPGPEGGLAPAPDAPPVPEGAEARKAWIEGRLAAAESPEDVQRQAALQQLVEADQGGDTVTLVIGLLQKFEDADRPVAVADVIRALGRPGLVAAADPIEDFLRHDDESLRGNAAVSLEYIGAPTSVAALTRAVERESISSVSNNMYRAIGRCGAGEGKVRALLVKAVQGADAESASYGPIIGLAYFGQDRKTAVEVEKLLMKLGVTGGRRGGGQGSLRRALLVWCLTEVGFDDEKSEEFLREKILPVIRGNEWTMRFVDFYEAAAEACGGSQEAKTKLEGHVTGLIGFVGSNPFSDPAREGRGFAGFTPKGEWLTN
jgi:hypothetical protein